MKIKQRLFNLGSKKGFSYTFIAVLLLLLMSISMLVWEFVRLGVIVSNTREKFEDSLVVIATERYKEMYSSCRDGYAASFEYDGTGWANNNRLSIPEINNEILRELNSGEKTQVNSASVTSFLLTCNRMGNAYGTPDANSGIRFKLSGTCAVNIPFKLLWSDNFNVTIEAETQWISLY